MCIRDSVCILTHVVCDDEVYAKKKYLSSVLPEVEVITVDKKFNKCDVVDCRNAILVDDYMGNLTLWNDKGGIPVKFSDKGRECESVSYTHLTLPTKRIVEISVGAVSLKKKKRERELKT